MAQSEMYRFFSGSYLATDNIKTLASTQFAQRFKPPRKIIEDFIQRSTLDNNFRRIDSIWNSSTVLQEVVYGKLTYGNGRWFIKPHDARKSFNLQQHVIDDSYFHDANDKSDTPSCAFDCFTEISLPGICTELEDYENSVPETNKFI